MPVSFLNEAERHRFNRFPWQISDKDLVVFFALSASGKAQIRKQRDDHNQLEYSIQLCALRYLGFAPEGGFTMKNGEKYRPNRIT